MPTSAPEHFVLALTKLEARMLKELVEFALEDPTAEDIVFPARVDNLAIQRVKSKIGRLKLT